MSIMILCLCAVAVLGCYSLMAGAEKPVKTVKTIRTAVYVTTGLSGISGPIPMEFEFTAAGDKWLSERAKESLCHTGWWSKTS